jgi:methyl-accepting chemotaxis protein
MNILTGKQKNSSISQRLIFYVLGAVMLMNVFMLVVISIRSSREAKNFAIDYSESLTQGIASSVAVYMEQAMETTNTLANTLTALRFAEGVTREAIEMIFINVLTGNEEYHAVWTIWDPMSFDGKDYLYEDDPLYEESEGRFSLSYYLDNGSVAIEWGTLEDYQSVHYLVPKSRGKKTIMNPYLRNYSRKTGEDVLITSVVTPIFVDRKFLGLVGLDMKIESMQGLVEDVVLFESGTATILSNDFQIAAHQNKDLAGTSFRNMLSGNLFQLERAITSGTPYSYEDTETTPILRTLSPVKIRGIDESWAVMAEIPLKEINAGSRQLIILIFLIGIGGIIIISLVVWQVARNITKPIIEISRFVDEIALGRLNGSIGFENRTDEVGLIARGMKQLLTGLRNTAEFARKIGDGNYNEMHHKLSDEDELGEALIHMQQNLKLAKEEEIRRKEEDELRSWVAQGQSMIAETTRQHNHDLNELSYQIISKLVKYMKINQGGLFVINNDNSSDIFIELKACYAFDRRKYSEKRIEPGEGLVGACMAEKKTVYMEKLPQNYIRITSGLGDENPGSLLIVPLLVSDEVLGIIELASFKTFKKHEIDFVEKAGEIIASSISSMKIAHNTRLLLEKSQQQANEMRSQEEEMRQNMEELSATQEAMLEKERISQSIINDLNTRIEELKRQNGNSKERYESEINPAVN